MAAKLIPFFWVFLILFSVEAFSQEETPSKHPLKDKYYPTPAQPEPPKTTLSAPGITNSQLPNAKPITQQATISNIATPKPIEQKIDSSSLPSTEIANEPIPSTPAMATSPSLSAPTISPSPKPTLPPTPAPKPASDNNYKNSLYGENRLGSSSPLYDTYEKNKNGNGGVTTSPK